jgi:tRNA-splicing endonuclease subunit Sen15, fungi type
MASKIAPAALQQLIAEHGSIESSFDEDISQWDLYYNLALAVMHNLQHQQRWTQLKLHTVSPLPPYDPLIRPLLSGLPPRRLYVHPDEQIEHLKQERDKLKTRTDSSTPSEQSPMSAGAKDTDTDLPPVREWVLPVHIRETWTLSRLSSVFDGISNVPPDVEPGDTELIARSDDPIPSPSKWQTTKRVLLATVDDDSTIVYYIVHDGIVKPRQN